MPQVLRVASWNLQSGVFADSSREHPVPDVQYLGETIRGSKAHIVCLQEVPVAEPGIEPYLPAIARVAEYDFTLEHILSNSDSPSWCLGLAILSKYPLELLDFVRLMNPNLSTKDPRGQTLQSHDKGFLVSTVDGPYGPLTVASGHLLPFHKFGRSPDEAAFASIRMQILAMLDRIGSGPAVVCADFNLDSLQEYLGRDDVRSYSVLVHVPTRPSGHIHDNIVISGHWAAETVRVLPTRSDHSFCFADIALQPAETSVRPASGTPSTSTVLHLSDLHLGQGETEDDDWKVPIKYAVREDRLDRLRQLLDYLPSRPDFVIVSGDVTASGATAGFEQFNRVVDACVKDGKLPDSHRFVVVPGNHDVADEGAADTEPARWEPFVRHTDGRYIRPWIRATDGQVAARVSEQIDAQYSEDAPTIGGIQDFVDANGRQARRSLPFLYDRHHKVLLYAFNSASIARSVTQLDAEIATRWRRLRSNAKGKTSDDIEFVWKAFDRELRIDPARVDPGELDLFMRVMVCLATKEGSALDSAFKIAVLHHHVAPVVTVEEAKKFELLLNAGRVKRQLVQRGFHLVAHGHKHWPEAFVDSAISGGGSLIVISGGTIGGGTSTEKRPGFHWLEIDRVRSALKVRYVPLGQPHDDPSESFGSADVVFAFPRPGESVGVIASSEADCEVDLRTLYDEAEAGILKHMRRLRRQSGIVYCGWMHRVDNPNVSVIATAYGLMIMDLVGSRHPQFLAERQRIVDTILAERLVDEGWSASSQGNAGRPEATAWVLGALTCYGVDDEVTKGIRALEAMYESGRDPEAWSFVFTLALTLRTVVPLRPSSGLVSKLAAVIEQAAARDGLGRVLYWGKSTLQASDRWYNGAEPSIVHTAHAMIALMTAHRASGGKVGVAPEKLSRACEWLLDQAEWENEQETLARWVSGNHYEPLQVNHFTKPWVVMALLQAGCSTRDARIRGAVQSILAGREDGLWKWGAEKGPIWATYDALKSLTDFALRDRSFVSGAAQAC